MSFLTQRPSAFWWTRNIATVIYFMRELTGVFIAAYLIYFLGITEFTKLTLAQLQITLHFKIMSVIGFAAACVHTITWLWVSTKVTPRPLPRSMQIGMFILLLAFAVGTSYTLLIYLYEK